MAWITGVLSLSVVLGLFLLIILSAAIKIVNEWERGVILRLGRLVGAKGPGIFLIIPIIDKMVGSTFASRRSTFPLRRR